MTPEGQTCQARHIPLLCFALHSPNPTEAIVPALALLC